MAHAVQQAAQEVSRTGFDVNGISVDTLGPTYSDSGAILRVGIHAKSEWDARTLALLWGAEEKASDDGMIYLHADWHLMDVHVQVYARRAVEAVA